MILDKKQIDKIVLNALEEDMPYGDVTTDNLIPEDDVTEAKLLKQTELLRVCPLFLEFSSLLTTEFR